MINQPGITLTLNQLEAWAGRPLNDDQLAELDDAIPNSSIPDAISTIAEHLQSDPEPEEST